MSKLKETFATRRTPVPQFIVELVYNLDGTEKNEEEFIIDLQNQLLECSSRRNPTVLTQWSPLTMSLYRFLERHIETLQGIKTQGYINMQELNSTENKIIKLLETLKRIYQQTTGLINIPFPYFGQLLDLTWNSQILINLTQIGLEHLLHTRHQKSLLENLAPLFNFWTPFSRLMHHYGWDFPELNFRLNELSEASENKDERLRILREHFIEPFQDEDDNNNYGYGYDSSDDDEDNCDLWTQVKNETLPLYDNKYVFVTNLASELRENSTKKIKDSNIRERYYILGKALFTFFVTNPVYDELFFSHLLLINAFQGFCNHCIQKNDMYEKSIFKKAKCYKSDYYANYLLLPDPIFFPKFLLFRVKKLEEIKENEDELLLKKMSFIMNIFIGLNSVIAIIKSPNFEDQSKASLHTFMREFMCMNNDEAGNPEEKKENRPPLSEIFKIIHSQYESDCAIKKSLDLEPSSQLLYSISTQVPSILMYNLLRFNSSCVFEMTGHLIAALRAEDNADGFRLGYFIVVHGFIVGLLQLLKNCGFEYQYMSLDVLDIAFSTLADFCNHTVTIDTQICVLLSKILENRIKWTTTNEFCEYFKDPATNPAFLQKLIQVELDHLSLVLGFPSNKKLAVDMRMSYLNHICTFETIDFISAYEPAQDIVLNQFALKSQEQLIRSYLTFNLRSQIITYDDRGDQFVYYSFERLQQIWKIIAKYSSFEFNMIDEFNHSYKIIKFTIDSTRSSPRYYKVFDLDTLSLLLSKCLFNLSVDYDLIVFDNLKQVLGSFYKKTKIGYDNLLTKFSVCLQETFEDLFAKMDYLQNLYLQGNTLFNKEFLITENKLQKLIARLFRFLDILPEPTQPAQVFLINPALNQVIINSLSKLLFSPVSHAVGFVNTVEISNFISKIPPADKIDLLQNVLAHYAQKLPPALALVEKELAEKPVKGLLERKLEYYDTGSLSIALNGHQFFGDTVYDNLREIHGMNSVLFPALMLGSLEAREFIVPEKLRPLAEIFVLASSQHLMEIIKSTLNIRFFLIRDNLREDEDVSQIGDVMGSDDDFYSWYSIPFIRDYLIKKALILVHMLNNPDPTKTAERNFGVRLAALLTFEDMASKMQSNDLLDLLTRDDIAENILKALLQNIFDFCEIVSNNASNPLGEYIADSKIEIKEGNELYKSRIDLNNLLWSILRHSSILDLIKNLVTRGDDKQIKSSTSTAKKLRKSLRESVLKVIDWSLDKIDDQLLILILLMSREEQTSPFAQLLECIYVCYETVLTQLIYFETHQGSQSSQPSFFGRMDEEQLSNYGGSASQSQSRLALLKQTYLKFLSKFVIFSNIMEYAPRVPQSSRDVVMELFEGCKSLLKIIFPTSTPTTTIHSSFINSLGVQIYQAQELSDFRTSVTMLFFLSRFKIVNKIRQEEEYKYYIETMRLFLVEIGENMKKLKPDLFPEEDFFLQKDFMPAYKEIIHSFIFIGEQMLLDGLETHGIAPDFYEIFDLLCLSLKKLHEICQVNKAFWSLMKSIFDTENLMLLFYASLYNTHVFEKFCQDTQMLEILIQHAGKTFYSLAEIYALQAFDPEKILPLKLKALVSLDKSGNNIIYNNSIKNLQIYYPQTLSQIWQHEFSTQDFQDSTKTIVIKQTSTDKTQVPFTTTDHHQEQTILIPSLTYLKEGIHGSTRHLLMFMMDNVVSLTQSEFQLLLNDLDSGTYHRYSTSRSSERNIKNLHNTISCLSVLLRNYPELSVFVMNYEPGEKIILSQNIPDLTPNLNNKETFLTFFIKYACYFYNFSVSYLVEDFVRKSETPIYVTYKNEPVLLSTYNEIQIFHVILKLLEETLQFPQKLLRTLYSCTAWTVLANISIKLLSMEITVTNEKDYRLEIIKSLDFLCTRGLQLFYKERESSEEKNSKFKNNVKIFYGLRTQLAELEMSLKTKNYLLTKDQSSKKCSPLSFKNFPWIGSILKEQFYLDADPILSSQQTKNFSEIFQQESWSGISFLKSLPPFNSQGIEPHVLTRMLRKIQMRKVTTPPNLGNAKLFEYLTSSQEHLRQQLSAFDSFSYFYPPDHRNENKHQSSICSFITKYDRIREDAVIHLREFAIKNWSIPRMPCLFVFEDIQKPDRYHLNIPLKFHLFLKRTLKPKNDQMVIEEKKSNSKNPPPNPAKAATSFMFKQSDLENIAPTIEENKARIKLLLHQHDEKVIMAKFQAALNQTVNITHLLSLEVENTNQDFFDKQTDSDKELILMLANPHFIDSLTEELRQKSRVYKKAIDDKKRADAEAEVYTDSSDDDDEIEVEDDDSESEEEQQEHVIHLRARIDLEDSDVGEEEPLQNPVIVAPENPLRRNNDHDSDFGDENPVEPANLIDLRVSIAADAVLVQEMEVESEPSPPTIEVEADGRQGQGQEQDQRQSQSSPQKILATSIQKDEENTLSDDDDLLPLENSEPHQNSQGPQEEDDQSESDGSETAETAQNQEEPKRNYDRLADANCSSEPTGDPSKDKALLEYQEFLISLQSLQKFMVKEDLLPQKAVMIIEDLVLQSSLEEWIAQIFYFLTMDQKDQPSLYIYSQELFRMDNFDILSRYLMFALLDPVKEAIIIPLFALYLIGYQIKLLDIKPQHKTQTEEKIIFFFLQYALRSPSIFFRVFEASWFEVFIASKPDSLNLKTFSVLDIIMMLYIMGFTKYVHSETLEHIIQRLLDLLLQIRFTLKVQEMPEFVQTLHQKEIPPIKSMIIDEFYALIISQQQRASKRSSLKFYCRILQHLACLNEYRKGVLTAAGNLLRAKSAQELETITKFIKSTTEKLESSQAINYTEQDEFHEFLTHLKLTVPEILRVFTSLLEQATKDSHKINDLIEESENCQTTITRISICYMDLIELVDKLQERDLVDCFYSPKKTLKKIIEMLLNHYAYTSGLKELAKIKPKHPIETETTTPEAERGLLKRSSDQDSLKFHQVAHLFPSNRDDEQPPAGDFQEIFAKWVPKVQEFIGAIFQVLYTNGGNSSETSGLAIVKKFPRILSFDVKDEILRESFNHRSIRTVLKILNVRRDNILEDSLKEFESKVFSFRIKFIGEAGIDAGGLKKEFLTLTSKELFDPLKGLFKLSSNKRTLHPNPMSILQPDIQSYFRLAGIIIGLAIKEKVPVDVNFSRSFLKLLMSVEPGLNDLEDIEPELTRSLRWMLTNDVTDLEQDFTYELNMFGLTLHQELQENGSNITVTEKNKGSFISKICLAKTLDEVEPQIQSFKQGLFEIFPEGLIRLFSPGELGILISGKSEIDIKEFKKYTKYSGFKPDSQTVIWFWEIVEKFDQNMLANLLFFITGSSKIPHGGFKDLPIVLTRVNDVSSSLPVAHTCFGQLDLPIYQSKEQLHQKLLFAINEGKEGGFFIA